MAVSRYCPHGKLRSTCSQCKLDVVEEAEHRAALNRARGESNTMGRIDDTDLPYPWQRESMEAWTASGRSGLVALSLGLPLGDLPFAVIGDVVNASPTTNVLLACDPAETEALRATLAERFGLRPTTLIDHHFLEPRADGSLVVADLQELSTVDLASWGRFASNGLLVLLDADGINDALGELLLNTPFRHRFAVSRQPSAIDLISTRPWARAFGPLLYRSTEDAARDLGILPKIKYRLHVEMLRPESQGDSGRANPGFRGGNGRNRGPPSRWEPRGPVGPWESGDIPTRLPVPEAGPFLRSRARDVAVRRAREQPGLVVVHEGVPVPGAAATLRLADLPDRHGEAPSGWLLASPASDFKAILRLATVAFKTLGKTGAVEDAVVLPIPVDLCKQPPWSEKWRAAANQIDRVAAGLLLAESVADAMAVEDLESLVGVALALRGLPQEDLYALTPVVAEAAEAAHAGHAVSPERVSAAARATGGLAAALLVAAELGPLHLLRIAHPRFTPVVPDLPHPSLLDARAHAWRGRAFAALANANKLGDLVTAWGRYPELRFVFPSSSLLEAATAYCAKHKLKGPLDGAELKKIPDKTRIAPGDRAAAATVLREWNDALGLAEEHEREFLADMHARQPERERRREGVALPNLAIVDRSADSITFEPREGRLPITNISPGSEVAIVEFQEREELARGLVSRISSRRVTVEFPSGAPRHRLPPALTVNLVFDAKVFEAYHSAVLGAQRALSATQPADDGPDGLLRAALLGETDPPAGIVQEIEGGELTPTQRAAVNGVLSGGRVRLIHGPPGTGKTHTLVHLAMALAKAGHSVLCTADSNAAVDNLVVGLRRSGFLVVRIGHAPNLRDEAAQAARIDPNDAPLFVRWAAEQGIVVATTNYGAFRYIDPKGGMSPYLFDYVIHDEAGQATAPSSLAAVMRGRRLVLAGDPKQLPPTVVSIDAKEAGLDVTLFERIEELTGGSRTRLLATQFRMREPIVAFSNRRYYDGKLETHPSAAAQEGLPELPAAAFQHVTGRENERQRNGSISNDFEVECVAALVERFRSELRERGWTLAVLTPYQAQREAIRRRLPDVEVSTVDGAQGREWDVVLYSTVRSNPQHRLGFLEDERRLNVAVTRARRNFVLVGDERTLGDNSAFQDLLGATEKVRLHYPPQQQRREAPGRVPDEERGGRRRRRRRGRGRFDEGPAQGRGGDAGRTEDRREQAAEGRPHDAGLGREGEGSPASRPRGTEGAPAGSPRGSDPRATGSRAFGRRLPDDSEFRAPPMPDLPDGPRPERRSFTVDADVRPPPALGELPPRPPRRRFVVDADAAHETGGDASPGRPASPARPREGGHPAPGQDAEGPVRAAAAAPTTKPAPKGRARQAPAASAAKGAADTGRSPRRASAPSARSGKADSGAAGEAVAGTSRAKGTPRPATKAKAEAGAKGKAKVAAAAGKAGKGCAAKTKAGTPCKKAAQPGSRFCAVHA